MFIQLLSSIMIPLACQASDDSVNTSETLVERRIKAEHKLAEMRRIKEQHQENTSKLLQEMSENAKLVKSEMAKREHLLEKQSHVVSEETTALEQLLAEINGLLKQKFDTLVKLNALNQ